MKQTFILFLMLVLVTSGFSQHSFDPLDLFSDHPKTKVLFLDIFHFNNPGLDDYKPQFHIDIKSGERQKHIKQILKKLGAFRPTKFGLEFKHSVQTKNESLYQLYLDDQLELPTHEI